MTGRPVARATGIATRPLPTRKFNQRPVRLARERDVERDVRGHVGGPLVTRSAKASSQLTRPSLGAPSAYDRDSK